MLTFLTLSFDLEEQALLLLFPSLLLAVIGTMIVAVAVAVSVVGTIGFTTFREHWITIPVVSFRFYNVGREPTRTTYVLHVFPCVPIV